MSGSSGIDYKIVAVARLSIPLIRGSLLLEMVGDNTDHLYFRVADHSETISNSAHLSVLPMRCHPERSAAESKDLQLLFGIQIRYYFRIGDNTSRTLKIDVNGPCSPSGSYSSNPLRRSTSAKRGSDRSESNAGFTLML